MTPKQRAKAGFDILRAEHGKEVTVNGVTVTAVFGSQDELRLNPQYSFENTSDVLIKFWADDFTSAPEIEDTITVKESGKKCRITQDVSDPLRPYLKFVARWVRGN